MAVYSSQWLTGSALTERVEAIHSHLHEYRREDSAKAFRYYRVRHSVEFNLPIQRIEIEFRKGEARDMQTLMGSGVGAHVFYVPFTVEKIGDNRFVARD